MRSYHHYGYLLKADAVLGTRPVVLMHYVIYFSQQISEVDIIIILIQQMRKLKLGV